MSRIPPVPREHMPTEIDAPVKGTLFQVMAHRPAILQPMMQLVEATMQGGTVEARLKELVAIRVSQVNHCYYCMSTRTVLARQLGVSEELLDALYHIDQHRHLFTGRELAALRYAETMTTDARAVDEQLWDELQRYFDDGELVELSAVIGLFNFFNRFSDALQFDPPQPRSSTISPRAE